MREKLSEGIWLETAFKLCARLGLGEVVDQEDEGRFAAGVAAALSAAYAEGVRDGEKWARGDVRPVRQRGRP